MALPSGVASLYFPDKNLNGYFSGDRPIELIFSDDRFAAVLGDTKIIDQILVSVEQTMSKQQITTRWQKRGTLSGCGFEIFLRKDTKGKVNVSKLWRTQFMYILLPKLAEYGYEFLSHESDASNTSEYHFKEQRKVLDDIFGPRY